VAARWAELHPERVDRLVLLCPGFDLPARWPAIVGREAMGRWQRDGWLPCQDAHGRWVPVHWGFIEQARRQPAWPQVPCPTLIVHGRYDEIVPIDSSRRYAATRASVELLELDDDHSLTASIGRICDEVARFFEL
jgi:pimeloyl-ACP methyl ester carboxylesterase